MQKDGLIVTPVSIPSSLKTRILKDGESRVNISWKNGGAAGTLASKLYILAT